MPDPTLLVRRALRHLTEPTAMRAEVAMLRRQLAELQAENRGLRISLLLGRYARDHEPPLPALRVNPGPIPAPRPAPEGVPRATRPRSSRRRP